MWVVEVTCWRCSRGRLGEAAIHLLVAEAPGAIQVPGFPAVSMAHSSTSSRPGFARKHLAKLILAHLGRSSRARQKVARRLPLDVRLVATERDETWSQLDMNANVGYRNFTFHI